VNHRWRFSWFRTENLLDETRYQLILRPLDEQG
jgi:hypothetical protein